MANELIVAFGTQITLEANGASIAAGAVGQADDATYDLVDNGGGYPEADFVLTCTFDVAPAEGALVYLFARALDIDGTADAEVPEAGRPGFVVGSFATNNVTTAQSIPLVCARDLPKRASYYLHNATTQTISAGWLLKATPRTVKPA